MIVKGMRITDMGLEMIGFGVYGMVNARTTHTTKIRSVP